MYIYVYIYINIYIYIYIYYVYIGKTKKLKKKDFSRQLLLHIAFQVIKTLQQIHISSILYKFFCCP